MNKTARLASAACAGALLLACSGQRTAAPVPFASADAYYALGRVEHAARRSAQARRAWEQALQVDPRHADARNGMAVLLAEQGDYGKATALWRALLEEGKALPDAERAFLLGNLGYVLYLQGESEEALALLEQACVLDPRQPLAWEHLAAVLETQGQTERALKMMKQARTLRTHDIGKDYAMVGATPAAVPAPPQASRATPWPADMPRTEIRQAGAVLEVRRMATPVAPDYPSEPAAVARDHATPRAPAAPEGGQAGMRLMISNGNGVRGMAAAWARRLQGPQWKSVRLTNVKPFAVPATRIEHRGDPDAEVVARALAERLGLPPPRAVPGDGAAADLRIVLGWDQRNAAARAEKKSAQGAEPHPDAG